MTNQFRVSTTLPRKLEELRLSPETVLRQAGLPMGLFNQEKILVSTEERIEHYDPIKIAALSARSFRDAVQRLARYKRLTCPEEIRLVERGNECAVQFVWLLAHEQEPPLLVDVCFAWIVSIGRRGTRRQVNPKRVELQRASAHRKIYEAHFQCPLRYGARQNVIVFDKADVERPFQTHNADLLAIVAPQLEAELTQQLAQKTVGEQVKGILKKLLAGQRPGLDDVARELRLSTRTLQRRLTGEGATFQKLMEDARRELAQHYLLHSALELNETAYLLGYEDANSFFRAFHHWEGTSPGEWRAVHTRSGETPETGRRPA